MNKNHKSLDFSNLRDFSNHRCLAFKICCYCKIKYCYICSDDVHQCVSRCNCCHDFIAEFDQDCNKCSIAMCANCSRQSNDYMVFCKNCFIENICKNCGIEGKHASCDSHRSISKCRNCSERAIFSCAICHNHYLCLNCYVNYDICINCINYNGRCPDKKINSHYRCPSCYNVFTDKSSAMKKRLLTTLLCLSSLSSRACSREKTNILGGIPKPIRLMICERMAVFN